MRRHNSVGWRFVSRESDLGLRCVFLIGAAPALAQSSDASDAQSGETAVAAQLENAASNALTRVTCVATSAERTFCAGDASAGVVLIKSNGPGECLLGRTWGYDQTGVWVRDGCSGEFAFGGSAQQVTTADAARGTSDPTRADAAHRDVGRVRSRRRLPCRLAPSFGELSFSAYGWFAGWTRCQATRRSPTTSGTCGRSMRRNDIYPHRMIIYSEGLVVEPEADLHRLSLDG